MAEVAEDFGHRAERILGRAQVGRAVGANDERGRAEFAEQPAVLDHGVVCFQVPKAGDATLEPANALEFVLVVQTPGGGDAVGFDEVFQMRQAVLDVGEPGGAVSGEAFFEGVAGSGDGIDGELGFFHGQVPFQAFRYCSATRRSSMASRASQSGLISPLMARMKLMACWRIA